ncbi:MAG: glycosyltransferase family 4 protein [Anaerolineae bacterium]
MSSNKRRIAIVVQRYGEEVSGGAELHARWLAEHLLEIASVDVFTTCAKDYLTWANEFPEGTSRVNGVRVTRYPVDRVREPQDTTISEYELFQQSYALDVQYEWMWKLGPASSKLMKRIERSAHEFDAFIFFTYEYAHTVFGLPLVADKSILVPTAHEQRHLQLPLFRTLFRTPRAIAYNTAAEQDFVERFTDNQHIPSKIVGIGINEPEAFSADRFRQKYKVPGKFITYLGRLVADKGVDKLIQDFIQLKEADPSELSLVLMGKVGKGNVEVPDRPDIIQTGFVTEQDKFDGLAAADLLVLPSKWESLSMISMEAWLVGTPNLVNSDCGVMVHQVRRSQAGLHYRTSDEFCQIVQRITSDEQLRNSLATNGRQFVLNHYSWDSIIEKFNQLFDMVILEKRA